MKRFLLLCTIAFALMTSSNVKAQNSTANAGDANAGRQTFNSGCVACHAVGRRVIGPDLRDIDKQRSQAWLIKFIHSPQGMQKAGDTAAVALFKEYSPNLMLDNGSVPNLSDNDIKNVIAYIRQQSDSLTQAAASAPAAVATSPANTEIAPYTGGGILHRLIFIDEPGHHMPLTASDVSAWAALIVAVIFLAVMLAMCVNVQDLKEKYSNTEDDDLL